jgi:sigma-B regulation protein RsbU (phosphoserine phosphatase)
MDEDAHKSRLALIKELQTLRRQLAAARQTEKDSPGAQPPSSPALPPSDVIIAHSPAILFRRLAADDPKQRRMVYVSPNIARFGYQAEDFLANRIMYRDIIYAEDWKRTLNEIAAYVERGVESYSQVYRIVTRDGRTRWVEDRTSVVTDAETGVRYHQGIVIDIHRRKEAEDRVRRSEEKYRRIVETAGEGFLLMDATWKITDTNAAFGRMLGLPTAGIGDCRLLDLVPAPDRAVVARQLDTCKADTVRQFEMALMAPGGTPVPVLMHAGTLRDDTGTVIGNMAFVADMTASKKALALAGEVQRSLLPRESPRAAGLDIAGHNVPCDEVGGDYFDFLTAADSPEGPCSLVVGDISGHGVDSALLMTSARAFLRMRAAQGGGIAAIVSAMNRHLTRDVEATGRFMTLFYLTISSDRRRIEWVRAGHDPAWCYDPMHDRFEELAGPGLALGIDADFAYQSQSKNGFEKGQIIVVGTDGIWEGCNPRREMFGKQRLKAVIRRHAADDAATILEAVFEAHAQFTRGARAEDDLTLIIVKLTR